MTDINFPELPSRLEALRILDQGDGDFVRRLAHHALIAEEMKARANAEDKEALELTVQKDPSSKCALCDSIWMYAAHLAAHLELVCSDPIDTVLQQTTLTLVAFTGHHSPVEVAGHFTLD